MEWHQTVEKIIQIKKIPFSETCNRLILSVCLSAIRRTAPYKIALCLLIAPHTKETSIILHFVFPQCLSAVKISIIDHMIQHPADPICLIVIGLFYIFHKRCSFFFQLQHGLISHDLTFPKQNSPPNKMFHLLQQMR